MRKIRAPQSHAAPVWCLPVAAGLSAVWAGAPLGAEMTALEAEGTACEIIGRRRLIGGRATLHIMLVAGPTPRDGAAGLASFAGGEGVAPRPVVVRMAQWAVRETRQVAKVVARMAMPGQRLDHAIFERFLSLSSQWRLPARCVASHGGRNLFSLTLMPRPGNTALSCFVCRGGRVEPQDMPIGRIDGRDIALLLPDGACERAFVMLGDDLVEVDFAAVGRPDGAESRAFLRSLPRQALNELMDLCLRQDGGSTFAAMVGEALPRETQAHGPVTLKGVVRRDDRLLAFVELRERAHLEGADARSDGGVTCQAEWESFQRRLPGADGLTRLIVVVRGDPAATSLRLSLRVEGTDEAFWVRVSEAASLFARQLVASFWPVDLLDHSYFRDVAVPVPAGDRPRAAVLDQVGEFDAGAVSIAIKATGDAEALRRTLLALRLTAPEAALRILVREDREVETVRRTALALLRRYRLSGRIELFAADRCPAEIASGGPVVLIREGAAPLRSNWLDDVRQSWRQEPDCVLVGLMPRAHIPGGPSLDRADILSLFDERSIIAVAFQAAPPLPQPLQCLTFEGGVAEMLIAHAQAGCSVISHDALRFDRDERDGPAQFADRFDGFLLHQRSFEARKPRLVAAQAS